MSLKNKLNRLKSHLTQEKERTDYFQSTESNNKTEVPFLKEWTETGVVPYFFDDTYCLVREVSYPISYQHGRYQFKDFVTAVNLWNHSNLKHPLSAAGHEASELFFFDTETTGLGGGAGNIIFLLGYASFKGNEIVLRQHILPHPGAEVPLYQSFLENVNYRTLVTYNGKSFDWPQVKTRHTFVREQVPKLPPFGHFDLYHASRRLWKHKLDRLKLAIVEKEILGVERHDDVPGYLAPMIFFDFVERKNPEGMIGILKHNEVDILSLITLYTHLSFQLLQIDQNRTRAESFEVGRWFDSLGEKDAARSVYSELINDLDEEGVKSKMALAYSSKKKQHWSEALGLFLEVANIGNEDQKIEANIEAAKIFEHKFQKIAEAFVCSENAYEILNSLPKPFSKGKEKAIAEICRRRERLNSKRGKFPG